VNAAVVVLAALLAAAAAAGARDSQVAKQWQAARVPAPGPALSIGTTSCGCLQGAAALPASGPGYEVIRLGRNRRFGHPELVAYIRRLGAAAQNANLGLVIVGDLSQPRGGPTPSGHRSHQTGLDADVGYVAPAGIPAGHLSRRTREQVSPVAVIDLKTHDTTPAWTPAVIDLLALAAADPAVDRIFVNPAIKKLLCAGPSAQAPWQGRLRPWWSHHDHFHVRLKCPADSPLCVPQTPPADDGCGATLAWWFGDDAQATRTKKKESEAAAPEPQLPPACAGVIQSKSKSKSKSKRCVG
jgi:penicillin-insensitive murein endopeptidase